jgi:hypothetical protein
MEDKDLVDLSFFSKARDNRPECECNIVKSPDTDLQLALKAVISSLVNTSDAQADAAHPLKGIVDRNMASTTLQSP